MHWADRGRRLLSFSSFEYVILCKHFEPNTFWSMHLLICKQIKTVCDSLGSHRKIYPQRTESVLQEDLAAPVWHIFLTSQSTKTSTGVTDAVYSGSIPSNSGCSFTHP